MHSSPFSRHLAHFLLLYSSLTMDRNERAGDDADGGGATLPPLAYIAHF